MSTTLRKRPLLIEMDIKVRTYDIDSAGHVSNINYLYWMEDMRLEVIERYFSMKEFLDKGYQPVIAATHIEYKRAIKLFDKPKGFMWISELGNASYKFEGEIYVDGQLTTHATHVGVFVDVVTGKPRRLPAEFIEIYRKAEQN
ncbi:MAG TPA: thioesterase family protein [Planktothrix sp.]|jgi:acyl-CoA thioester hydrolase